MTGLAPAYDSHVQHRACALCGTPVDDQCLSDTDGPSSRGWIHTMTGQYRCPPGTPTADKDGTGLAYAFPAPSDDMLETARTEAYETGFETGQDQCEMTHDELADEARQKGHDEGLAEGISEGRAAYSAELNGAITAALHEFLAGELTRNERDLVFRLNDALTAAWVSVDV